MRRPIYDCLQRLLTFKARAAATIIAILLGGFAMAQVPQGISYQAAAKSSTGATMANTTISVRFTIHDSAATGTTLYQETFSPTTNTQGVFSVNVGMGTPVTGAFSAINWGTNAKFMQVEMYPAGGSSYLDMGTTQMMSVPYALYASNSGSGIPSGIIISYGGSTIPNGWLLCDGSTVSRATYATLYTAIGNNWGAGDNVSTFNLPDLRGLFLRGVSGSSGIDPDVATRNAINSGGNVGNNVGSIEGQEIVSHSHGLGNTFLVQGCCTYHAGSGGNYYALEYLTSTSSTGGNETRPINANVYYIIKY